MNPEVKKVLEKFSQEASDNSELNKVLVELLETSVLIKKIDSNADKISKNRQAAYKLAQNLKSLFYDEINVSFGELVKSKKELTSQVGKLRKVSQVMEDAGLDDEPVQDELKMLDRLEFRIKEGIKQRNDLFNDLKSIF